MSTLRDPHGKKKPLTTVECCMPVGPLAGIPISELPDYWVSTLSEWRWVRGRLREAVERELAARAKGAQ